MLGAGKITFGGATGVSGPPARESWTHIPVRTSQQRGRGSNSHGHAPGRRAVAGGGGWVKEQFWFLFRFGGL